jgi:hypothetical protein
MKIQFYPDVDIASLKKQLINKANKKQVKGMLVLACDSNNYNHEELSKFLVTIEKPLFGGIFPAIIFDNQKHEKGFIIAEIEVENSSSVIENISSPETNIDEEMMKVFDDSDQTKTFFVFIDGFSKNIKSFIESMFSILGLEFNIIGGGAGSLSLQQKPCIITNSGLKQDCAVIAKFNLDSGIGVKHGWESISGPFKITSAEKTIIKELDYKPAFEVYKEVVDKHSNKSINEENFFEIAKAYPFGINKIDAEMVVRDPLFIGDDGSLICVGEVETGSFVDILTGNNESLIKAARSAVETAMANKGGETNNFIFFVDCISRVLFLGDDFKKELEAVHSVNKNAPLFGMLSIGEIANNGKDYFEFYNKTSVIGCF